MNQTARVPFSKRYLFSFLKVFFRLLYHQFAWTYDFVAAVVSLGMWKEWVFTVLPFLKGPRILEIGHGPGHLQIALHRKGLEVIGLDESRQMGRLAFKELKGRKYFPLIVNGYAQFIPFSPCSFQQVVSTFPSEYIVDPSTLSEVYRVLAPGGELLILPAAWITGQSWLHRLAAWLFRSTGQAPDLAVIVADKKFVLPFKKAGFNAYVEKIQLESSLLLIIHAVKPNDQRK